MEAYTFKCTVDTPIRDKMFQDYNRIAQLIIRRPFQVFTVMFTFVQIFLPFNLIYFLEMKKKIYRLFMPSRFSW